MKRWICLLLAAMLLCGLGCVQPQSAKEPGKDYAQRVVDAWREKGFLTDMAAYSDEDLLDYYGIDVSACICAAGFADAVGYTDEAVVVAADEATAKEIEALLSDHLDSVKASFRSYDPDALKIAEDAVFLREGGVVLLIVSPNAQAMLEAFRTVRP